MSTYEAAFKSLLQGVSQQLPHERLDGQVTSQVNMVSDPVTNLRRRAGVKFNSIWQWTNASSKSIIAWFTDIGGVRVHILLNIVDGSILMLDELYQVVQRFNSVEYLTADDLKSIRATTIGNEFFILNTEKTPVPVYGDTTPNPDGSGFFYVTSGAFSKGYSVAIKHAAGTISASYTTPSGTGAGDAALSTPEYIAEQLYNQIVSASQTINRIRVTGATTNLISYSANTVSYDSGFQININTTANPVWRSLQVGDEIDVTDIAAGKLRASVSGTYTQVNNGYSYGQPTTSTSYYYNGGTVSLNFLARVGTTWLANIYTTGVITVPTTTTVLLGNFTVTRMTVPATLVTSIPTIGTSPDPLLAIQRDGPYVFLSRGTKEITVDTSVGTGFMITSKAQVVPTIGSLPSRLPALADGFIVRVGTGDTPQYYQYIHAKSEWIEKAKWGSPAGLTNMPVGISLDDTLTWQLNTKMYEGRNAGDDTSNPLHEFMQYSISGMGTYQGRLVLLSGPMVSMSASGKPRRFFRSTLTSLLNSDPIEIGSGMNSAAAYEYAIPFQKDLVLFSRKYQAVVPSANTAITPSNATVVPTSAHEVDTTSAPIVLGRTLMYCSPRSSDFFGAMEMLPSNYTESQYVSQDSTAHIPKYMAGRCRFAVASGVSNFAVFASSADQRSLIVHEYHWDDENKVQQAWHQWVFPYDVAYAYFASDKMVLVFVNNGQLVLGTIDHRENITSTARVRTPFVDFGLRVINSNGVINISAPIMQFDPQLGYKAVATNPSGTLAGDLIGTTVGASGYTLRTDDSHAQGLNGSTDGSSYATIGIPYYSGVIPTPPTVTDRNGGVIHSGKATCLRYNIGTKKSSEYTIQVQDRVGESAELQQPTLSYSSAELALDTRTFADADIAVVPCRTDLRSTSVEISTTGVGELNITSLEYVAKFHPKITRR